jgi:diguanylate cyclase (GGDEF)-like protein
MIADIEEARHLEFNEHRLNRRYVLNSMLISLLHSLLCLFYFLGNDFIAGPLHLFLILTVIWAGNIAYAWAVLSGRTASWKDPVMSAPMTLWLTTSFLVTAYYVDAFRITMVMLFFVAMLLASFRQRFLVLAGLSLYAGLGYLVVISLAIVDRAMELQLSIEVLQWFIFSVICVGFVLTGSVINALRTSLAGKNTELADALKQVRDMAIRDELTGLFNRRHIMEILGQQQALADSGDYCFSICYLDLDHFKPINDRYGHGVGDQVLSRFALVAREVLREADYIGRLGGEEFVLVLPGTDRVEACQVAERLRRTLAQASFTDLGEGLDVTVSAGVAEYRSGEDLDMVLARADASLYLAKQSGRNQVVCEQTLEEKQLAEAGG